MREAKLQIKGMHCQSCATLIEEEIKNLSGVKSASVDFNTKSAIVIYDEKLVNKAAIFRAVGKTGEYEIIH